MTILRCINITTTGLDPKTHGILYLAQHDIYPEGEYKREYYVEPGPDVEAEEQAMRIAKDLGVLELYKREAKAKALKPYPKVLRAIKEAPEGDSKALGHSVVYVLGQGIWAAPWLGAKFKFLDMSQLAKAFGVEYPEPETRHPMHLCERDALTWKLIQRLHPRK